MTTPFLVAAHEARHAVTAWCCGFQVTEVRLAADGESGRCVWEAPATADICAVMWVCLAGAAGDGVENRSTSDVAVASSKYTQWCKENGPQAPFELRVAGWLEDCRFLLLSEEERIRRVANALLEWRRLTADDLRELLPRPRRDLPVAPRRSVPAMAPHGTPVRRRKPEDLAWNVLPVVDRLLIKMHQRERGYA